MAKFYVKVTEQFSRVIAVDADSKEEAIWIAGDKEVQMGEESRVKDGRKLELADEMAFTEDLLKFLLTLEANHG